MGRSWPDLWCQAVSRRWSKNCVARWVGVRVSPAFRYRVQSPRAICGERLSTIEHVSHDDCCKSDSILQGAVTGDHVVSRHTPESHPGSTYLVAQALRRSRDSGCA